MGPVRGRHACNSRAGGAAALVAVDCLTGPERQRTTATVGGQPSVLRELGEDPAIADGLSR